MKKYFIFVLLLVLFIPFNVFALPREGVYYFFTYPNGLEVVSENYEDTVDEKEILLYSGTSDSNGEVVLEGWDNQGTIRIVEKVPNGYSIESKEITVDLSKQSSAEFVNTKGMINPKTGKSLLLIFEVLVVVFGFCFLVSRKKKVALFIALICISIFIFSSAKAEQENFTIIVKDKDGKKLSNVAVEVYAKAVTVDASPAVKVLANGGEFLDGEEEMYVRIPNDGCSTIDYLNYSVGNYFDSFLNLGLAHKMGFQLDINSFMSNTFYHGDVVRLSWKEVPDDLMNHLIYANVDFNGGTLYFRGKKITELSFINTDSISVLLNRIHNNINNNSYFIGAAPESSCLLYDSNGIRATKTPKPVLDGSIPTYYFCWHDRPDGIYVNDTVFVGNVDTCYGQSGMYYDSDINQVELRSSDYLNKFYLWSPNNSDMYFSPIFKQNPFKLRVTDDPNVIGSFRSTPFNYNSLSDVIGVPKEPLEMVEKIQIVENGETILTVNSSDFQAANDSSPSYIITNSSINSRVYEYIGRLAYNNCFN